MLRPDAGARSDRPVLDKMMTAPVGAVIVRPAEWPDTVQAGSG
jgi:hypothetical protein